MRIVHLADRELLALVCRRLGNVYGPCMDLRAAVLAGGLFTAGFPTDYAGGFYVGGDFLFGEYLKERWSLGLQVRAIMPAVAARYNTGEAITISRITGAALPCVHWSILAGCVAVEGGATIGGGAGHYSMGSGVDAYIALGPHVELVVPLAGRFALRAFAELQIVPLAPAVNLIGDDGVTIERKWVTPIANGLFGVGFSY